MSSVWHTGFADYGAYWRYNYETMEEEEEFKYTRDQLMEDVRLIYKQVCWCVYVCLALLCVPHALFEDMKNRNSFIFVL